MHPQMILSSTPDMDCISSTIWRRHTLPYTFLNTWASECNHEGVCHVMIETWMILYLSIYEYRTVDTHHDHDIYKDKVYMRFCCPIWYVDPGGRSRKSQEGGAPLIHPMMGLRSRRSYGFQLQGFQDFLIFLEHSPSRRGSFSEEILGQEKKLI